MDVLSVRLCSRTDVEFLCGCVWAEMEPEVYLFMVSRSTGGVGGVGYAIRERTSHPIRCWMDMVVRLMYFGYW
jgi:hypothetical protein